MQNSGFTVATTDCGVTPQSVVATVKPEFCITHAPGYMLITDLLNSQLAVL